jgi:hypothetical protein
LVKKESNVKLLRALYLGGGLWIWENMDITRNETGNYVEFTTTELSIFCLAEIKIPPGKEDNPFLIFLMENMIWIIILAAVGISVPTIYVVRSRKKKGEVKKKKLPPKESDLAIKAAEKRKSIESRTWKPEEKLQIKAPTSSQEKTTGEPKVTKKKIKPDLESIPFSPEERLMREEEIKKTENEMDIQAKEDFCQIHRGPLSGITYVCPTCKTKYCLKCAESIKIKGEKCWGCEHPFEIDTKEQEESGEDPSSKMMIEILEGKNGSERFDLLRKFEVTTLSKEFWNILKLLDWDEEEKQVFINEMLSLSPSERDAIIEEMIRNNENFKKDIVDNNNNDE